MLEVYNDEYFMRQAYFQAQIAFENDEVPVGAVVVCENKIIARAHNLSEKLNDVTAHAEMQAITAAADFLGSKYLLNCTLYVTLEPCVMCGGALYWSQISNVIYACNDEKRGASSVGKNIYHPKTKVLQGPLQNECQILIQDFFAKKRKH